MDTAAVTSEAVPSAPAAAPKARAKASPKAAPKPRAKRDPSTRPQKANGRFAPTGQDLPPMVPGANPDPNRQAYDDLLNKGDALRKAVFGPTEWPEQERPEVPTFALEVSPAKPFLVWTAGPLMPRPRILTPFGRLKVAQDYAYHLTSPEQVAWAKQALGKQFWPSTVTEDEDPPKCETCGWTCLSHAAMNKHLNEAHGKPQFSGTL